MNTQYVAMEYSLRIRVTTLNDSNYFMWSNDFEILFREKGLGSYLDGEQHSATLDVMLTQKKDMELAYIMTSIAPRSKTATMTCRDTRDAWQTLKRLLQPVSEAIDAKLTQKHKI